MKLSRPESPASAHLAHTSRDEDRAEARRHGIRDGVDGLRDVMNRLLGENGCPWDKEQTLETLRPYLLEEAYEVLESMEDPATHRTELGDLLFQVVFQSAIRERAGAFDLDGVADAIRDKMIRRHPHVFPPPGQEPRPNASQEELSAQWARIKEQERAERNADEARPPDPLAGVPRALPALARAWRLQEKAAAIGFDWPDVAGSLEKFREEWNEFEEARTTGTPAQIRDEFGDVLFVLVRIGQKLGIAAEDALGDANAKFERRFAHMMKRCHERGVDPDAVGLAQLDAWWQEAKREGL